jgi:hypothetical protein
MFLPEHYPIVTAMINPFDYQTFLALCRAKNVVVMSMQEYAEAIDSLFPGRRTAQSTTVRSVGTSPRSCCGGGRSR